VFMDLEDQRIPLTGHIGGTGEHCLRLVCSTWPAARFPFEHVGELAGRCPVLGAPITSDTAAAMRSGVDRFPICTPAPSLSTRAVLSF